MQSHEEALREGDRRETEASKSKIESKENLVTTANFEVLRKTLSI